MFAKKPFILFGAILSILLAAPLASAGTIQGIYMETRTCQVYTGPCFANAEIGLAGKDAIMAWKIQQGADKQYERYLDSGDPRQRQIAWDKTRKLDQTSGWFVVGSQLFIQILIYSYIDEY